MARARARAGWSGERARAGLARESRGSFVPNGQWYRRHLCNLLAAIPLPGGGIDQLEVDAKRVVRLAAAARQIIHGWHLLRDEERAPGPAIAVYDIPRVRPTKPPAQAGPRVLPVRGSLLDQRAAHIRERPRSLCIEDAVRVLLALSVRLHHMLVGEDAPNRRAHLWDGARPPPATRVRVRALALLGCWENLGTKIAGTT